MVRRMAHYSKHDTEKQRLQHALFVSIGIVQQMAETDANRINIDNAKGA